ncbi:coiled-coil domain-containing protein 97 [Ixodes scapularis]|uniref:coiled-coil domain-containing protein 97 n=1 Tax=Ixodes scapularis TaxID=6945 RepID=UPI001A9E081C|nr:coiled-coil domain-containing protein 97 [Ixodes scapularis]
MAELETDEDPESPSAMHVDDSAAEAESEAAPMDRDEQRRQILDTVAASDGFFKHQQRNEPDLTYEEKRKIAEEILDSNTALFLQRFSRYLYREDASYFEPLRRTNYEVDFYLRELEKKRQRGLSVQTKNRRYEALQRLQSEGDYFSDKEVRRRNPLLFEQMVGRYMTEKEKEDLDKMDYSTLTFSGLLMHHIDRNELSSRRRQQQDVEEATFEENDSDSEDEECDEPDAPVVSATEKAMLRSEFMNTMYESFLSGKDHDYDYESVDNNAEYDSLKTRQNDEEEKYFDAEEPEVVDAVT